VREGTNDAHPELRAGDGHVQAAVTDLLGERTEAVRQIAIRGLTIADRQNNGVALIALHGLEVLDEEALFPVEREEVQEVLAEIEGTVQRGLYAVRVLNAHGDHAERFLWSGLRVH